MRHHLLGHLCLALSLVCLAAPAHPAPSKDELATARRHYESGAAFFKNKNYEAARTAFEEAYRLSQLPDLLFNLALVARTQSRSGDAAGYLEEYLRLRPDAPDRGQVETQLRELRAEIELEEAKKEQALREQRATEERTEKKLAVSAQPAAPAPERPWRSRLPPLPAMGLAAGGVGLLIIGIALGGAAIDVAGQVDAGMRFDRDLHERGQSLSSAAIALDVLGGLALAAGGSWAVVWYVQRKKNEAPAPVTLAPRGLGLTIGGHF